MSKIDEINEFVRSKSWMDFEYRKTPDGVLIIGSKDFTYYHEIEITFKNVSTYLLEEYWNVDMRKNFITLQKEGKYLINNEDIPIEDHFVIASEVSYNTDMVYYYKKENLKKGERLVDFLKQESGVPPQEPDDQ